MADGVQEPPERVVLRVLEKVVMGQGGCHISTYSVASHGYAQVGWHANGTRHVTLCHRVVWNWFRGHIPDGMTIDHMCKNRRCVRLAHLRMISNLENARRTSGRDWALGECINGHPNEGNWLPAGPGRAKGYCKVCRAAAEQRRRNDPVLREKQREAKRRWAEKNWDRVRASRAAYAERKRLELEAPVHDAS